MMWELAPAAVLRAAAWPVDTLDAFGVVETADYDTMIAQERAALWERTAGDPRFMKALVVASAPLAERVSKRTSPGEKRDKRARHLDTSLYRYLARACTNTTPHGLWSGVTVARFGEEDRATPTSARVDFTPDLIPFAVALSTLGERPRYRDAARVRLSPTFRARADGHWTFLARAFGGGIELREMRSDPSLGPLLDRIGNAGAATLDELATRANVPRQILEALRDSGALVGGLALTTRFVSSWEALRESGEQLLGEDRSAWREAMSTFAASCKELADDFDRLSPQALAEGLARAQEPIAKLFATLGLDVPLRSLRCDLRLPFDVTLGAKTRTSLSECLARHDRPMTASTRERRLALMARLPGAPIAMGDDIPPLSALESEGGDNPWGCLVARLAEGTHVIGIDDSPVRPFARFRALVGDHEAERWVRDLVAKLESDHGVIAADLAVPFEGNPNVQAGPRITRQSFEPWSADGPDLRGASLAMESGALVMNVPSVGRVMLIAACSAAAVPCDPMAGPFPVMGFNESFEAVPAPPPPVQCELNGLPRAERFARWLELANEQGWPKHVTVRIGDDRPLVVPARSPLAVEAAFEGAGESAVTIAPADASARIAGHVADVAVPFARTPHIYSSLRPSGVRPAS